MLTLCNMFYMHIILLYNVLIFISQFVFFTHLFLKCLSLSYIKKYEVGRGASMIPRRKVVAWEIGHAFNSKLT